MKNTTHRVVILNNVNSELISQAILILKNSDKACESAVLEEAERVVEQYMNGGAVVCPKEKGGRIFAILFSLSAALIAGVCIVVFSKII